MKNLMLALSILSVAAVAGAQDHGMHAKPMMGKKPMMGQHSMKMDPMMASMFKGMTPKEMKCAQEMMAKGTPDESRVWSMAMKNVAGAGHMSDDKLMAKGMKGMSAADMKLMKMSYAKLSKDQKAVCMKMMMNTAMMKMPKMGGMGMAPKKM